MTKQEKIETSGFKWWYVVVILVLLVIFGFLLSGIIFIASLGGGGIDSRSGNVALIEVKGVIVTDDSVGLSLTDSISSTELVEQIEKADQDPSISAIVLDINSPGGSAVASSEIGDALKRAEKPTVAWIRDIGTSGAYWVASATDHIIAHRASITGSVGVIASYLEFGGLLEDHNVTYRRLVAGSMKDIGSPFKEMTEEEQEVFQKNLDQIQEFFIDEVKKNRLLKKSELDKISTGVFYIGKDAKDLGLVDELGGKYEVIKYLEEQEGIVVEFKEFKEVKSFIDILAESMGDQFFQIGKGIGNGAVTAHDNNLLLT